MSALAFRPVQATSRRAKVLLLGEAGSGKTHAALTFPKPAVIDAEGSIDWFADRFDFVAVPTKSYADVRALIQNVRQGRVPCETLVIDSLTSIYNGLLNAASSEREDLRPLDWGRIKRKFSSLLDELYHQLPMHVVCVGWIKPEYAKPGDKVNGRTVSANDLVKIGETFDGDRKTLYAFDFVFKLEAKDGKHFATVLKSRSGQLREGQRIENFSWKTVEKLLPTGADDYHGMTDDEAVGRDRGVLEDEEPAKPVAPATAPGTPSSVDSDEPADPRGVKAPEKALKPIYVGFAKLSLEGPAIAKVLSVATGGRLTSADDVAFVTADELRALREALVGIADLRKNAVCDLCTAQPNSPHLWADGEPCPHDQSTEAVKWAADRDIASGLR